jgi:hypothetical protein
LVYLQSQSEKTIVENDHVDDGERRFGLENVSRLFILLDFILTFFFY